jgi:FixJ family two-component response regulator
MNTTGEYCSKPFDHLGIAPMIIQDYSRDLCAPDPNDSDLDTPTVFVVDPDPTTGDIVNGILKGYPFDVQTYATGREFFAAYDGRQAGCLILENRIADTGGLQIQRRLTEQNQRLPMIYVASSIDVATAVGLMRGGAVHILEKPVRSIELFGVIQEALASDRKLRRQEAEKKQIRIVIAALTHKERQLVRLIATTTSNKVLAEELSVCARAVELRRRGIMEKLGYESSLELVRFALLARDEIDQLLNAGGSDRDD